MSNKDNRSQKELLFRLGFHESTNLTCYFSLVFHHSLEKTNFVVYFKIKNKKSMVSQNTNKVYWHRYFSIEIQTGLQGSQIYQLLDSISSILEVF